MLWTYAIARDWASDKIRMDILYCMDWVDMLPATIIS